MDILVFTVEELICEENQVCDEWKLQPSGRFAHSENYIRQLVKHTKLLDPGQLQILNIEKITPRYENGYPISGLLVVMEKQKQREA